MQELPILETVAEAYKELFRKYSIPKMLVIIFVPIIIGFILFIIAVETDIIAYKTSEEPGKLIIDSASLSFKIITSLLIYPSIAIVSVGLIRFFQFYPIDRKKWQYVNIDTDVFIYAAFLFIIDLIVNLPLFIFYSSESSKLPVIISITILILAKVRFFLVPVSIALKGDIGIGKSWNITKKYQFQILALIIFLIVSIVAMTMVTALIIPMSYMPLGVLIILLILGTSLAMYNYLTFLVYKKLTRQNSSYN